MAESNAYLDPVDGRTPLVLVEDFSSITEIVARPIEEMPIAYGDLFARASRHPGDPSPTWSGRCRVWD